jgi:isopentenyl phosphate kinase
MPISRISSIAILNKLQNRLSRSVLPTVPCILGPFKVHHALCDWEASMNILPNMVYDCLDEDPLVPTPHQLRLVDFILMQPYGIAKDVLIEFQDSSNLVDLMVMDMDPRQQTSIILGKPFLKSVSATIDKTRVIINMTVDGVLEKFIYHPKSHACCC